MKRVDFNKVCILCHIAWAACDKIDEILFQLHVKEGRSSNSPFGWGPPYGERRVAVSHLHGNTNLAVAAKKDNWNTLERLSSAATSLKIT
jgi:hypothetical protein